MVAGEVSSLAQSHFPSLQPLHVILIILKPFFMLSQCFTIATCMMAHISRIRTKENRQDEATLCLVTMNNVNKFVQAKFWRGIVDRKHRNKNPRFFNGLDEWWCDFISSLKIIVINEGMDSLVNKSLVEIARKTVPSVSAPKTEEHLVSESIGKWRGWGKWLHSHEIGWKKSLRMQNMNE